MTHLSTAAVGSSSLNPADLHLEAQYRQSVALPPDLVYRLNRAGVLLWAGPGLASALRRTQKELEGTRFEELFPTELTGRPWAAMVAHLDQHPLLVFWHVLRLPAGERWVETRLAPRTKQAGEDEFVGVTREVIGRREEAVRQTGEREMAEGEPIGKALEAAHAQLRRAMAGAPVIFCSFDRQGICTMSEGGGLVAIGSKPGAAVGLSLLELFHDNPNAIDNINRALSGETFTSLAQVKGRVFQAFHTPLLDDSGDCRGTIGLLVDITARQRAEAALRRNESMLRATLESISDGLLVVDQSGQVSHYNRRFLDLWSIPASLMQAGQDRLLRDHVSTQLNTPDEFRRRVEEIYQGEIVVEDLLHLRDGRVFERRSFPLALPGEKASRVWLFRDITQARQAAAALAAKTEELDRFFSVALDLLCIADTSGRFRRLNPQWEYILGYPLHELEGQRFLDFVHPEDRPATESAVRSLAGQEKVIDFVNRYRCKDGSYRWIEWRSRPVGGMIYAAAHDITERKRAEAALEGERSFADAVLDSVPGLLYLYDDQGRLVRWNKQHEVITGFSSQELSQMRLLDWYRGEPEEAARITAAVQRIPAEGHAEEEAKLVTKSGRRIPFYFTAVALRIDSRNYFVGIGIDVTAHRQAEAALRASLKEKEALLKEVHHRVKNNLQIVTSLLNLQSSRESQESVKAVLRDMQARVRAMALLHEALYRSPSLARVDFAAYVQNLCAQLTRSYRKGNQRVRLETQASHPRLNLEQAVPCGLILSELVTNAFKHAFPGGRDGEIRVSIRLGDNNEIEFSVADNGIGWPPGFDLARTGPLGLQLVVQLTEQLGGTLRIEPGPGASITIRFPVEADTSGVANKGERPPIEPG